MEDTYHLPPYDQTRTVHIGGQTWTLNARNTDNENGLTGIYGRCVQFKAANDVWLAAGRRGPVPFCEIFGPYTDAERAFGHMIAYIHERLGVFNA